MSAPETSPQEILAQEPEGGINLVELALTLLGEWRLWAVTFLIVSVACTAFTYSIKAEYQADASFIPKDNHPGNASVTAFLSNNAGPGAVYIGMLRSRTVQDVVVQRTNLIREFHAPDGEAARGMLNGKTKFAEGTDTLVTITVRDKDSYLAARIANAYLDALQGLNESMGLTQSRETALMFEGQLREEREGLAAAEAQLAQTQKNTGLIAPAQQTQIGLAAIAALRGQITSAEVQLAALLQGATEENPRVQLLRSQIQKLRSQESQLEGGRSSPAGAALGAEQMPQGNLTVSRAEREVQYHSTLVESLARQLEAARLGEVFSHTALLTVDRATPPKSRSWPPRMAFLFAGIVFAAFIGLLTVVARLGLQRVLRDPTYRSQVAAWRAKR